MKIGIVATHSFPIPTPTHTGDIVILDLANTLGEMGHEVTLYAPEGTTKPVGGRVLPMPCSLGKYPPSSQECEQTCFDLHREELQKEDIVHDFSITKQVIESLIKEGKRNVISTLLSGQWLHPSPPINIVVWSNAMKERGLRGASDYEGTRFKEWIGPKQPPVKDAHVVNGGIDTEWYSPRGSPSRDTLLWMNRWHPAKGYREAIDLARKTGLRVILAGEHPDREMFDYQKQCALEAASLAADLPNVTIEWLPADPDHHLAKRELYRNAKALLYTVQFCEPFGLSQVEALACGTPVIGTRLGSVPEVVTDGLTGFVVDNNIEKFVAAVGRLDEISNTTCRDEAVRRFDRRVMAEAYLAEYQNVIDGKEWGQ